MDALLQPRWNILLNVFHMETEDTVNLIEKRQIWYLPLNNRYIPLFINQSISNQQAKPKTYIHMNKYSKHQASTTYFIKIPS